MDNKKLDLSLPNNYLAEQIILGSLILDCNLAPIIFQELNAEVFYLAEHKVIFQSIKKLYEQNSKISFLTILHFLEEKNILLNVGGAKFLTILISKVVTTINLQSYIELVQEKYFRRLLILLGKYTIERSYKYDFALEKLLSDLETKMFLITSKKFKNTLASTTELLGETLVNMKVQFERDQQISGLSTAFKDLDFLTQGLQKSELIIIAGRPSMGKTAFALNIGKNIADYYKLPILIFSLEMSKQQLIYRFLSILIGINSSKIRNNNLNLLEWKRLKEGIKNLSLLPIYIDDTPFININEIRIKSRDLRRKKNNLGLIIIDYLQLMQSSSIKKLTNRAQELGDITRALKLLARELDIPIILLSQLSRNTEARISKRPLLSDLRDSGCFSMSNLETRNIKSRFKNILKAFSYTGKKPVYSFSRYRNFSSLFTNQHLILTTRGWKAIDLISSSDKFFSCPDKIKLLSIAWIIKKIEYKKIDCSIELEMLNYANYIKSKILFHNSIEQDADLVLMLYREDYYNEKLPGPRITEIIISKHRNGPTGTIHLIFDKISLGFRDLIRKK